jgi:FHS family glucose/mannose:H+ symporter-like MFS transporter
VTYFWLTMAIGRVFTGVIAEKVNHAVFLLYSTFGAVIFTVLFAFVFNSWTAFAVVLLIGLFMSGIFAISLIYANHLLPGKPATTSILIASGGIGGALIPLVIGWLMDHYSVSAAVLFIISGTVILLIMSFIAYRMRGNAVVHNTGK